MRWKHSFTSYSCGTCAYHPMRGGHCKPEELGPQDWAHPCDYYTSVEEVLALVRELEDERQLKLFPEE